MPDLSIKLAEIPDGGAVIIAASDRLKIAVFRVGDRVAAIENRCPRAGGSVGEGDFDGTTVKCPLHGFRVDVWRAVGNAGKRVTAYPVSMRDGLVHVAVPEAAA